MVFTTGFIGVACDCRNSLLLRGHLPNDSITTAPHRSGFGTVYWNEQLLPTQPGNSFTDGFHYLAEHGGAYWLIDAITSWQGDLRISQDPILQDIQLSNLTDIGQNADSQVFGA